MLNHIYSKSNDECYTPGYAVNAIIEYIELYIKRKKLKKIIVWCPFDEHWSNFVVLISTLKDVEVVYSHINDNKDFFTYEPKNWDIIVSNPPFKNKRLFFERALSFNKPFALLMSNLWLNDKASKFVYKLANREMQLLFFDKKIHFIRNGVIDKRTSFSSSFFCCDFLSSQIVIKELDS